MLPCDGLRSLSMELPGQIFGGKIFETFWRASIHGWRKVVCYLIMPWCGLVTYQIGVTDKLFLALSENGKKLRKYMYGRSRPYIYV